MTPQQIKAKELVEKMYSVVDTRGMSMMSDDNAKQCAIIAVDEIIGILSTLERTPQFYVEVKEEINNL